jgi:Tfp pilus assembly protein PilV
MGAVMRIRRSTCGISIIEVVVAIGILSVGIYGAADLFSASSHSAVQASNQIEALALANLKCAEISVARSAVETMTNSTSAPVIYPTSNPAVFQQNPHYYWQATFQRAGEPAGRIDFQVSVFDNGSTVPLVTVDSFLMDTRTIASAKEEQK